MFKTQYLIFTQRLWQGCAGILTLAAITNFITPELQGWYYSFLSLSAIYVVFDHGLSLVLVQTSAHSFLKSNIEEDSLLSDEDRKSLHSLVFASFQRYQKISASFLIMTSTFGFFFFNSIDSQIDGWEIAWICLVFSVALNLLLFPFLSIIEGSGKIRSIYKLRLIQSVVGSLCCWALLVSDSPLWAPIAVPTVAAITQTIWLWIKWKHLLVYAKKYPVFSPQWETTVWPLEWRVALSYISTYTLTQFITPIVFIMYGSKLAGQVGLSLAATNMIALLSFSGITGNIPGMAKNAALKNWGQMDLLFSKGLKFGFIVYMFASGVLLLTFYIPSFSQFTDRALPPNQILILLAASFLAQIHASLVVQLRSYLVEPLLWISFWAILLMGTLIFVLPFEYGWERIIIALLLTQLFFILPLSVIISKKFNVNWRYSEHILRKSKMTLQANKLFGSPTTNSHTIAILMATYNGEDFLNSQLSSIETQSHINWHLHVSDDGSNDNTMGILEQFCAQHIGKVTIYKQSKNLGFVGNFMSLILNKSIQSDYYALCDQDDIWLPSKLEHALKKIDTSLHQEPKLYCARTLLISSEGKFSGFSPAFKKAPNFQNALVQSIGGGNTMVYNQKAHEIITGVQRTSRQVVSHDWWIYLLMTAVDARIIYDLEPSILYRQHKGNLVGSNTGIVSRIFRLRKLITGEFGRWISNNMIALDECQVIFSADVNRTITEFQKRRKSNVSERLSAIGKSGAHRQSALDNIALWIAVFLKKV